MNESTFIPAVHDDFDTLALTVNRVLTPEEVAQVSGCLGYALRVHIAGESLSDPVTVVRSPDSTLITWWYDSTKGQRSDRDPESALFAAADMIREGTPVRRSNRAGPGTAGTRLVDGIGPCALAFAVDVDPHSPFLEPLPAPVPDLTELIAAARGLQVAQERYEQALRLAGGAA